VISKYEEILNTYFVPLFLKRYGSIEAFEADEAFEDRQRTATLLAKMLAEAPRTAGHVFEIDDFPLTIEAFEILDAHLTPAIARIWMETSDPEDPNNFFKLNVSEFATHLGTVLMNSLGGRWRFSRSPNYFMSGVVVGSLEFAIFDSVIKKSSSDFGHESLYQKYVTFANLVHTAEHGSKTPQ